MSIAAAAVIAHLLVRGVRASYVLAAAAVIGFAVPWTRDAPSAADSDFGGGRHSETRRPWLGMAQLWAPTRNPISYGLRPVTYGESAPLDRD